MRRTKGRVVARGVPPHTKLEAIRDFVVGIAHFDLAVVGVVVPRPLPAAVAVRLQVNPIVRLGRRLRDRVVVVLELEVVEHIFVLPPLDLELFLPLLVEIFDGTQPPHALRSNGSALPEVHQHVVVRGFGGLDERLGLVDEREAVGDRVLVEGDVFLDIVVVVVVVDERVPETTSRRATEGSGLGH